MNSEILTRNKLNSITCITFTEIQDSNISEKDYLFINDILNRHRKLKEGI